MIDYLIENKALKYLKKFPAISQSIMDKIDYCLGEHLFEKLSECNKHQLLGKNKGIWRLHVPHNHVALYTVEGTRPERYAVIHQILPEEEYHNRL